MKSRTTKQFEENYASLLKSLQKKTDKQLRFLLADLNHPSLHAKKYDESTDIWQARIDKKYRFYFKIDGNTYILIKIKTHKD
ncbi:MAG: hypothetical protein A3G49_02825 [Candidatus Sungbacteria bacterium RIFCSPLOWO2_12_FULL_41_11]|uniref:Uncharacterized protein n=1 Tax=Candidatus Sungbacteria bacterium RIFCSPLOWO2_12_FULL_41_11 TaxID=1802286 RepID=A0A1G2LR88_9BACT|nr:MAG: hypothetical protein UV01_C0001G0073 [Parcubacteria group bacterium GW2011_GWA2_42_14]OHA00258.1 MAG: hypothetical protein A3D41_01865 [Candidatus Sungbacteria bacterium RIFCSPHIGHO2_02_FULL_41_12b]OHA14150.1 MAG: hypothetical protein A3G49_02825 [Candidatus Sungbacteria bacterium RIFCSPLOWO2_12_FULL_41_11]